MTPKDRIKTSMDHMTVAALELGTAYEEHGSIKATLIVNCQPTRKLGQLGITYNEDKPVLHNLVAILQELVKRVEGK